MLPLPLMYPDSRVVGVSELDVDGPAAVGEEAFADASKDVVTVGAAATTILAATPAEAPAATR